MFTNKRKSEIFFDITTYSETIYRTSSLIGETFLVVIEFILQENGCYRFFSNRFTELSLVCKKYQPVQV